ncbi:MAG TPA: hypothetical protein VMP01_20715 [Pirellulaceae bacterium]|nr:hypothetical protein [Pirellulaceae bacterium]
MATGSLEERVANLEAQMADVLLRRRTGEGKKDWRKTLGMFTGDEVMWAIDQNALTYREEDRRKSLAEFDAAEGKSE